MNSRKRHAGSLLLLVALACSCTSGSTETSEGSSTVSQQVAQPEEDSPALSPFVASLLEAHGMEGLDDARIDFTFRGSRFSVERGQGSFAYTQTRDDDGGTLVSRLDNDHFTQTRNGEPVRLSARAVTGISNSVNSVVYFAMLPLPLREAAVRIERLEAVNIDGRVHQRMRVTFTEDGGGDDHDDEFFYWFDAETKKLRFMAYRYHTGGGGVRFRVAKNQRDVDGVTFFDYDNYAYADLDVDLADLPSRRSPSEGVALALLSEIALEDIQVHR
ncbi:MAG: hypothetical protein ACI9KE_005559 [Polyangiales bacterium]|jgi:hypothetical protein